MIVSTFVMCFSVSFNVVLNDWHPPWPFFDPSFEILIRGYVRKVFNLGIVVLFNFRCGSSFVTYAFNDADYEQDWGKQKDERS